MKMTPMSKKMGGQARLGVMMISLVLDVRLRKQKRNKKEKGTNTILGRDDDKLRFLN
jgi:hypothetical protein